MKELQKRMGVTLQVMLMTAEVISAFLTYTLITALTPEPNNILILSSVNRNSLKGSFPVLAGMGTGFLVIMMICGIFTLTLINVIPALTKWLPWAGAVYITHQLSKLESMWRVPCTTKVI
ncbi:TPA: hypothetical protein U5D93_002497 [Yersinia enterocolitica]|nr:hypothetical protein [Yersinia enterocolitica]HDL6898256.1 hypothetical protein [Yersinia enterocolitica]HDL8241590.1 hypothetical protein [Yersinia enterocolitica]HDL8419793.1 hypothetical protein [Yersinia enterocolitica]HEN3302137.1 hypothetical protein [Yersinia enterocolitica]